MTVTDSITVLLCVFLLIKGANRGFLASLVGPAALILGTLVAYVFYFLTHNILISLCIGLFGPLLLKWVFLLFLRTWHITTNSKGYITLPSRVIGALLTWGWGTAILIITVLLLAILPPVNPPAKMIYDDIHLSHLYTLIKPLDAYAIDKNDISVDVQSLSEDPRIKDIVNDPEILEAIQNKNYSSLVSNKKISALMQDPELMKKMIAVYRHVLQSQSAAQ